ncbi:MAG: hypothetical protein HY791_15815 [Deltaproteobacteria bacterium]|nr:hypothetical protein [Deltaproteobacteria bacterium]
MPDHKNTLWNCPQATECGNPGSQGATEPSFQILGRVVPIHTPQIRSASATVLGCLAITASIAAFDRPEFEVLGEDGSVHRL